MARPHLTANRWLVVMAKEPRCGAVKTRLARDIGPVKATAFARNTSSRVMRRLGHDPRWRTIIAATPDTSLVSPVWPDHLALIPQGRGDLGSRMQRIFDWLPPGPVMFIGTDIPAISRRHIAKGFHALGSHDAVIGPGGDGGYWLVGLRRSPCVPSIFGSVRWSSQHTLQDTLNNLNGLTVAMLDTLEDVDGGETYRRQSKAASRLILPIPG